MTRVKFFARISSFRFALSSVSDWRTKIIYMYESSFFEEISWLFLNSLSFRFSHSLSQKSSRSFWLSNFGPFDPWLQWSCVKLIQGKGLFGLTKVLRNNYETQSCLASEPFVSFGSNLEGRQNWLFLTDWPKKKWLWKFYVILTSCWTKRYGSKMFINVYDVS